MYAVRVVSQLWQSILSPFGTCILPEIHCGVPRVGYGIESWGYGSANTSVPKIRAKG